MEIEERGVAAGAVLAAARRAMGWSQIQAAHRLASVAAARGLAAANPASLKTQLSRWENGHTLPDEQYRGLLAELYDRDQHELGLVHEPAAAQADTLASRLAAAGAVDDDALGLLREQLDTARRLDRRLGAAAVLGSVRGQLTHLERTLAHTLAPTRRIKLAALLAETAGLAGALALDAGAAAQAWEHLEAAKGAAREAESPSLLGHALAEQAEVLLDIGEPDAAVQAVEHAEDIVSANAPPPLRAWLAARRAAALASADDTPGARDALAAADADVRLDLHYPALGYLELDVAAPHRWRGHALSALADPGAVDELQRGLDTGANGGAVREEAAALVDLVAALYAAGRPTEAAEQARLAGALAARIGSSRLRRRLQALPAATTS